MSIMGYTRKSFFVCLYIGAACCSIEASANQTLLPPWYLLQSELNAVLSADPCVKVSDLLGNGLNMEVKINACSAEKANAIAAFVNKKYEFGDNLAVTVQVYSPNNIPVYANYPTTVEEAANLLDQALTGNNYFVKAGVGVGNGKGAAFAEFKPLVVHYYSDDIGDLYLNTNMAASAAFKEVFNLDPFGRNGNVRIFTGTSQ